MSIISSDKILEIINDNVETKVTVEQFDEDLVELGIDSISFIHIIVAIEEYFDYEIPDSLLSFSEMNTVNKILNMLNSLYGEK